MNPTRNHDAGWARPVIDRLCRLWSGASPSEEFTALLAEGFVFHWHHEDRPGAAAYESFVAAARTHAPRLQMVADQALSQGDLVVLYFHWASDRWHPDISGAGDRSNFGKIVLRIAGGKIAELWEQASDFLYLLGKGLPATLMNYPAVATATLFLRDASGLFPTDDPETRHMAGLFRQMNDCFLGHCPISKIHDVQEPDIRFDFDGGKKSGQGVDTWKTFAYALRTASHDAKAIRFDDVFIREGNRLSIFSRSWIQYPSPYILACANGMVAGLNFEASPARISGLHTFLENYVPFLDTVFEEHDARIRELFQGRRRPVQPQTRAVVPGVLRETVLAGSASAKTEGRKVAVVGMAGRFPGAGSVAEFWKLLAGGRTAFSEFPEDRAHLGQGTRIRHAALLGEVDRFDHGFFQLPALVAEYMDPQQRLLTEVIWQGMEDSGHRPGDFAGPRTGLFVASLSEDFQKHLLERAAPVNGYFWLGTEAAMYPAKLARTLDVQGPCRFVNAECAGALVAVHEAARLIRDGEIDQAIVGATNLFFHSYGFAVREDQLLSDEPAPRLFSRQSRGQLRGEAVVAVILKSLDRALADGDPIHGLVAGSAVNGSGATMSIVSPDVERQAEVIRSAWRDAGVTADAVSLIECQASGVRDGDFAEIAAIRKAFRDSGPPAGPAAGCTLATVKGNVGHAEAASGLTALVKLLLELRHRTIAGIQGLETVDPALGLAKGGLRLAETTGEWRPGEGPHRDKPLTGGINAFATGGYNAHLVVQEYRRAVPADSTPSATPVLIVCSGRTEADLQAVVARLRNHLVEHRETDLRQLAYTLQVGREPMAYRLAAVVANVDGLITALAGEAGAAAPKWRGGPVGKPVRESVTEEGRTRIAELVRTRRWDALAELWVAGWTVDWASLWQGEKVQRLSGLPGYPFAGKRHPVPGTDKPAGVPMVARPATDPAGDAADGLTLSGSEPCFTDHQIGGKGILPAAVSLQLAAEGAARHFGVSVSQVALAGVTWVRPCVADGQPVRLQFSLEAAAGAGGAFQIRRVREKGGAEVLCEGRAHRVSGEEPATSGTFSEVARLAGTKPVSAAACYAFLQRIGMDFGPAHRPIQSLWTEAGTVVTRLQMTLHGTANGDGPDLPSVLLDGAIHSLVGFTEGLARPAGEAGKSGEALAPFSVEQVRMHRPCSPAMWAVLQARTPSESEQRAGIRRFDIRLHDADGTLCVELLGVSCRLWSGQAGAAPLAATPVPAPTRAPIPDEAVRFFKRQVAAVLKIPLDRIAADTPFSEFGLDSALAVALTRHLETIFGPLSTTLFFECRNLGELAESLGESHRAVLDRCLGTGAAPLPAGSSNGVPGEKAPMGPATQTPTEPFRERSGMAGPLDIAIIGLAGRYPGARTLEEFWRNLCEGRDCITEIPAARWDHAAYFDADKNRPGKTYSKWGGFLDGVDEFDAKFFSISPWEAEMIDPQERLFLQCAFAGIEDAGYTRDSLARGGRVGVYVGVMYAEYQLYGASETALGRPLSLFSSPASIANRVSYLGNFRGPSLAVDTMCSSSLTAIHLACQSLMRGETGVAVAGGVNLSVHPNKYLVLGQGRFVSGKGRCESFGEGAEGYVPGEGVGVVILKPLAAALADGDHIYGVIRGSAVNHGGRNNGYTVPNPQAQAEVVELALRESGVDPRTISYVEAHGTGTSLGDPIEVAGLRKAYGKFTDDTGFCALGSVKSNIGHCESAAGIAGLTKVLLQMAHGKLVPSLHSETLNRHIDFSRSPFVVQQALADWKRPRTAGDGGPSELPLRAGLSSFGAGGSNAHLVVEEFADNTRGAHMAASPESGDGPGLIVLSARTPAALRQSAANLCQFLRESGPALSLRDVAYTLQVGREAFEHRLAFVAGSLAEAIGKLSAFDADSATAEIFQGQARSDDGVLSLFTSDDHLQAAVRSWVAQRKFVPLLELWVKGLRIDWRLLYADQPRRVRLPTYPFARDRFWIPLGGASGAAPAFDEGFYAGLLDGVERGDLSVAEAAERERMHAGQGRRGNGAVVISGAGFPAGNGHSDRGGQVG